MFVREKLGNHALITSLRAVITKSLLHNIEPFKMGIESKLYELERQLQQLPPVVEKTKTKIVLDHLIKRVHKEFLLQFR